jgi:hypothetical protein
VRHPICPVDVRQLVDERRNEGPGAHSERVLGEGHLVAACRSEPSTRTPWIVAYPHGRIGPDLCKRSSSGKRLERGITRTKGFHPTRNDIDRVLDTLLVRRNGDWQPLPSSNGCWPRVTGPWRVQTRQDRLLGEEMYNIVSRLPSMTITRTERIIPVSPCATRATRSSEVNSATCPAAGLASRRSTHCQGSSRSERHSRMWPRPRREFAVSFRAPEPPERVMSAGDSRFTTLL